MKHKISKKYYDYQCGDGCCDECGFEWYVNGEFVHRSPCEDNGWLAVLQKLGFDATNFPNAEKYYAEAFSIPMYADLQESDQNSVISSLLNVLSAQQG